MSSTQDVAREEFGGLPVLVLAAGQSQGRGRSGAAWVNADRALAASFAFASGDDLRPLSLLAGIAAVEATGGVSLKWPNDVLRDGLKVGGILVERSAGVTVIGIGLNLWWPSAPTGMAALFDDDPGDEAHLRLGALWCAALVELLDGDGWPIDVYRSMCSTLDRDISWEPDGEGRAVAIAEDGSLIVETPEGRRALNSGAVHHVR